MRSATVNTTSECTPGTTGANACSTSWQAASGGYDARDHLKAPCAPEASGYVLSGTRALRSVYGSCPFIIAGMDVPADNLGSVSNLRDIVASLKCLGIGDQTTFSAAMANDVTFTTTAATVRVAAGIWLAINFGLSLSQPETLSILTTGFDNIGGIDLAATHVAGTITPVNRNITVTVLEGCQVQKFFVPFAAPQANSTLWGPIGAQFIAGATVEVRGAPASTSGNITASIVGPYSSYWPEIAGAVNNS